MRIERINYGRVRIAERAAAGDSIVGKARLQVVGCQAIVVRGRDRAIQRWTRRWRSTGCAVRLRRQERWIEAGARVREGTVFLPAIEDAVAAAKHDLVGYLVSQSNAGRK